MFIPVRGAGRGLSNQLIGQIRKPILAILQKIVYTAPSRVWERGTAYGKRCSTRERDGSRRGCGDEKELGKNFGSGSFRDGICRNGGRTDTVIYPGAESGAHAIRCPGWAFGTADTQPEVRR